MNGKVVNMAGEDITPRPPTLEEEFMEDLIRLVGTVPAPEVEKGLFSKYKITKYATD